MGLSEWHGDVRREAPKGEVEELKLNEGDDRFNGVTPELPSDKDLVTFYKDSEKILNFPKKDKSLKTANDSGTLNLDLMLEEVSLRDGTQASDLKDLVTRTQLLNALIDKRFFNEQIRGNSPYETLDTKLEIFKNVIEQANRAINTLKPNYLAKPKEILIKFLQSVYHYRGGDEEAIRAVRTLDQACYLASLEMVYDAGESPSLTAPNTSTYSGGSGSKSTTSKSEVKGEKQRKKLNYGREGGNEVNRNEADPNDPEATHNLRKAIKEEGDQDRENILFKEERDAWKSLHDLIRKPKIRHERYGGLRPAKDSGVTLDDVKKRASSSVQHAMTVSESSFNERSAEPRSQVISNSLVSFAKSFYQYFELYRQDIASGDIADQFVQETLNEEYKSLNRRVKLCKRVLDTAEGVAKIITTSSDQNIVNLRKNELSEKEQAMIESLGPSISFGFSYSNKPTPSNNEFSGTITGSTEAANKFLEKQRIDQLALEILARNTHPEIKYEANDTKRKEKATHLATIQVEESKIKDWAIDIVNEKNDSKIEQLSEELLSENTHTKLVDVVDKEKRKTLAKEIAKMQLEDDEITNLANRIINEANHPDIIGIFEEDKKLQIAKSIAGRILSNISAL